MNQYNKLLLQVSNQYHIYKGASETDLDWKTRLIYSICGMMAYASLWDSTDDTISIIHLKTRIRTVLRSYKSLYPELNKYLPISSDELEKEITDIFLATGMVYHCPNRVAPAMMCENASSNILFQRGIALDNIRCISGIGFYTKQDTDTQSDNIKAMFGLEQNDLDTIWHNVVSSATFKYNALYEHDVEYLRLKPPFNYGYWIDKPDNTGTISILRTKLNNPPLYFLYHYNDMAMEISPLPQWQVEDHHYRTLACACLSFYETLPPIEYAKDGELVHIRMNYLLPPHELMFLKLYSWPESCSSLPHNFKRKLSSEVFMAIKNILSDEGYKFKEVPFNAQWSKFYS